MCRLQLQGELQAKNEGVKKYRGVLHGVKVILQNEGPRGLFRGIGSAVRVTGYCSVAYHGLTFLFSSTSTRSY